MSALRTVGLQLAIASTFGTQFTISAITNATEAVATHSASHGVAVNDIIEVTSGWKRLNQRVVRAKTVATNDVTYEGINTTSTSDYPTGEGVGTGREITAWTTITQLLPDVQSSGGGFQTANVTEIDDIRSKEIPILAEAVNLTFNYHWDASLSWRSTLEAAARSASPYPFRMMIGTTRIYGNAYWGYNSEPSIQNGIFVGSVQLTFVSDSTTYTT